MIAKNASFSRQIIAVERAIGDLRRGLSVRVTGSGASLSVVSAETAGKPSSLLPKGKRRALMEAAILLTKHAGLLPQVAIVRGDAHALSVSAAAIQAYKEETARRLTRVSEARVPLGDAEDARVIAFRPPNSLAEHLAVLVGKPETKSAPLVRLHSSCVTGDILGSLRCDCGEQLHGALQAMARDGSGILLYLNQEGRGIGIANKLRAYALQDEGLDTVEANRALGFDADERTFLVAAQMLKNLGVKTVRLLTNNPEKVRQLSLHGIKVKERIPLAVTPGKHNARYLSTKAKKCGHLL